MQAVDVLVGVDPREQRDTRRGPVGLLDQEAGAGRVGVELVDRPPRPRPGWPSAGRSAPDRVDADLGAVLVLGADVPVASRGRRRPAPCRVRGRRRARAASATRSVSSALIAAGWRCRRASVRSWRRHPVRRRSLGQWAKWRVPVKYIVTPAAFAASMVSSSRTEPPGCTIAVTPASIRICGPSSNGKNASEAATRPLRPLPGPLDGEPAGVDAVDLAHADADGGAVGGEQDRVGLHRPAGLPGEREVGEHVGRGRLAGGQRPASPGRRRGASTWSRICTRTPPLICRNSRRPARRPGRRSAGSGCSSCPGAPRPRRRRTPARRSPR